MANDIGAIELPIIVKGDNEIKAAVTTVSRLERELVRAVKAINNGTTSQSRFNQILAKAKQEYKAYAGNTGLATININKFVKAQTNAIAITKAESQALNQYRQARREATAANQRFDADRAKSIKATRDAAVEEERLKNKYVEGHTAMTIYSRELNDLAMARGKDIISSDQQKKAVEQLNMAMAKGTGAFANIGTAAQVGGRRINSAGMLIQQAGYQFGDFAVQVQGGTNPMVAFGQQATQMIGAFNLLPAATLAASVGIGVFRISVIALIASLGVIIPVATAIGAYFMRTREAAREASGGVDVLSSSIESLDRSLQDYLQTRKAAELGLTPEELIGGEGMLEALKTLEDARERLSELSVSEGITGGLFGFIGYDAQAADAEAYALALSLVEDAEERLAILRQKQSAERLVNYNEGLAELLQQLALAREIAEFGEDSAQVRQLESEQRIAAYNREIDKQVESNALTQIQADILKNVFAEVVNTESATESLNAELKNAVDLLTFAERSAQGLRAALESAANAGNSMQRQISIAQAQINAARQGASTQVAGVRAGTEFDVNSASSGPLAELTARALGSIAAAEAAELERLQGELSGLTDTPSGRGGGGGGSSNVVDINQILAQRREQIEQERTLLLLTGRQREEKEIYFELLKSNSTATIKLSETELMMAAQLEAAERARNSTIEEQIALQEQLANTIESSMENALMSMVDGTKSVKDAFKSMAAEIIKELYRVLVVQRIVGSASAGTGIAGSIATWFGGISSNANGNAFSGGNIVPFANGGVVGGPSMFPMSGGKTGLMGEAGPEAIMPLKRDKNGRLGVSVEGGSGSVVVNNNINVTGGSDPAAIRMEVAKLMPQITSATKAAVIDARRRGGQMRAAFSS